MRYDLHVHTDASACSGMPVKQLLTAAYAAGLDGIAVTDHNEIRNALLAKRLNRKRGFEVIVGEEVSTDAGHVLCYYVKRRIPAGRFLDVVREARSQGCVVAVAHPRDWLRKAFRMTYGSEVDALETINGRCVLPLHNAWAASLCKRLGKTAVAGSDAHFPFEVGSCATCFRGTLRNAIKSKRTSVEGSPSWRGFLHTALRRIS